MVKLTVISALIFICCYCCSFARADLRSDLREFLALVPRRRIGHIAARYYIFDPRFRQAVEYVRSDEFARTWQQMRKAPDFADLIDYVTEYGSGYDVTSVVDKLPNRLRSFQLSRLVPVEMMLRRDLSTFLREAVQSLPRAQISSLMARKVREGGDFAKFYKALRDKEFRELVDTARRAQDLQPSLGELSRKHINVDEIIQIVFELISWGPQKV
ncbi:hypothetical protein KR222_005937 [Zaprionus bogoriensis]|nr:hypothetical protein KR222_005937 [Zaprionus bogoriensis]